MKKTATLEGIQHVNIEKESGWFQSSKSQSNGPLKGEPSVSKIICLMVAHVKFHFSCSIGLNL